MPPYRDSVYRSHSFGVVSSIQNLDFLWLKHVVVTGRYIERLHRGDNVYNLRSPKAQLLWAKIAIAVLYLVDLALSYAYIDTSYLKWRLVCLLKVNGNSLRFVIATAISFHRADT
jgi:hypothetical protein